MDLHNFPFQMDLHNFPFQFNILVSVLMSKNSGKIEVGILYRSDGRLFEELSMILKVFCFDSKLFS